MLRLIFFCIVVVVAAQIIEGTIKRFNETPDSAKEKLLAMSQTEPGAFAIAGLQKCDSSAGKTGEECNKSVISAANKSRGDLFAGDVEKAVTEYRRLQAILK